MTTKDAAADSRGITVEDLWRIRRVGAPSLSPDGRWVAVEVTTYDMEANEAGGDVWVLTTEPERASGEGRPAALQLTAHAARDTGPLWSPDGERIAFLSKREGDSEPQIYLISPAGGEARRLTTLATGAASPRWFPAGDRMAFVSWVWPDLATDEEQVARLKERREDKVKATVFDKTNIRFWDHWLADGRVPHLFVVDVATGACRDVLAGTGLSLARYHNSPGLSAEFYDVSPDGEEIAFTADLADDLGLDYKTDVVTIPTRGGAWKNITEDNPADDTNPRYSPDGRWIAYCRQAVPRYYADRQRLALYDRATGTTRILTEGWDRSASTPQWSPDGRSLYFLAEDRARQPLWRLDLDAPEPVPLLEGTHLHFDVSRDGGSVAFVRSAIDAPDAVYAAATAGGDARKVDSFNDELVAGRRLGRVREVVYEGWGGEPVQMWVVYPPEFDEQRKWPLLHIVHGGPHAASTDQFHFRWNLQLFASRGYVVAAVNFHGSTGWGQEFTDSSPGQYGTKEFDDIERGTDYLLAEGYVDPERLAAAGGSFGGYMVAWMNGHTERYAAYVCHAGVYDWVSMMAGDVVAGHDRQLGAFAWDDPERVLRQSAHWYAKSFKTPTLVVHGELDFRVPVTQGFAYYATLRMLQVPSRLLYFPDENHWVLKPQNSRLWYREFFAWVEKYAPPGPR
jgi:dipeptidyl aminopeptidase/acylaminoacyl peptidase